MKRILILALLSLATLADNAAAQEAAKPRFSHKGLKGALAVGAFDASSNLNLKEGEAASLNLGYGFSDKVSLWLTALGVQHPQIGNSTTITDFGGLELNLQYKFAPNSSLQPYGKIGLGAYGLQKEGDNSTIVGGGLNLAFGLDFFFSRHVGLGAELMFKDITYESKHTRVGEQERIDKLAEELDGDTVGFMVTLTLQ